MQAEEWRKMEQTIYNVNNITECTFVKRQNRFVATVLLNNQEIDVHVKNTGRCKELLIPGSKGYLLKSDNTKRKYQYDLISIYKGTELVNFDSQVPNQVVAEYIAAGNIFTNVSKVIREVKYNNSRFDIYIERLNEQNELEKIFIEVKGVTLFEGDLASFPDAPTVRGTKHVEELVQAQNDGYQSYIFFLVQTEKIKRFTPNATIDPKFTFALENAVTNGVNVLCYNSIITKDDISINEKVEVLI